MGCPILVLANFRSFSTCMAKNLEKEEKKAGVVISASTMVSLVEEGIWLAYHPSRLVVECEVKPGEVEEPSGLSSIMLLDCHKVLQVLVVHPDLIEVFCTFDKVPPLLQGSDDGKHVLVIVLIVVRATAVGRDVEQNAVLAGDPKRKG